MSGARAFIGDLAGWITRLRPASFRGLVFYVENIEYQAGRRWADHEYPARNTPFAEDMGRAQRVWRITGYVIGDNYPDQRDRLVKACEQDGPGELIHPTIGTVQAACRSLSTSEERLRGRFCTLSFEFSEAGVVREPTDTADPDLAVEKASDNLSAAAMTNFIGV